MHRPESKEASTVASVARRPAARSDAPGAERARKTDRRAEERRESGRLLLMGPIYAPVLRSEPPSAKGPLPMSASPLWEPERSCEQSMMGSFWKRERCRCCRRWRLESGYSNVAFQGTGFLRREYSLGGLECAVLWTLVWYILWLFLVCFQISGKM